MRLVIIGLSVIFFVLSTIALYKGLNSSLERSLVDGISINDLLSQKLSSHQENELTINSKTTEETHKAPDGCAFNTSNTGALENKRA